MLVYFLIGVLFIAVFFLITLVIKKKTISKSTKIAYTMVSISLLSWQLILLYSSFIQDFAFLHRLTFFFALWFVEGWQMLSLYYPKRNALKKERIKLGISFVISIFFSILLTATKFLIEDYNLDTGEVNFTFGQYIFFIFLIIEIIYLIAKFYTRFKKEKESRIYFKYIFFATAIYAGLGLIFNLVLPLLGHQNYSIIGTLLGLVPLSAIFYTIYAKRVFSTKYIIGKSLYLVLMIIVAILCLELFYSLSLKWFFTLGSLELLMITLSSGIVFITIFKTSDILFNKLLVSFFQEEVYKYENIQKELLDKTRGNLSFADISESFDSFLRTRLLIENSNLIIFDNKDIIFSKNPSEVSLIKNSYQSLLKTSSENVYIISENLPSEISKNTTYKTIIVIKDGDLPSTLIFLGDKRSKEPLTSEEVDILETFARILNLTISRARLFQEIQDFNQSLQHKVDEQTKELQQKVQQLQEARRKEADMIDIMGHELRTPMSIVKLNADLLHNFRENVPTKKEEYIKYVSRIKDAVDTEIKLINTLLSSAKLEGNKIELNLEKVNIIDQIKMSIHAQEKRAKEKGIELITKYDKNSSFVYSDHARTVEILNNLIDNAVKYTDKGSVTVTTKDLNKYIEISIKDTGEGMTQEDISKLGQKFFRTGNYIKSQQSDDFDIVRPGGTGLGLYVTFSLIKKMGGDIKVDSKLGEGSTFTFTLPKYEGQEIEKRHDTQDMFERMGLKQ